MLRRIRQKQPGERVIGSVKLTGTRYDLLAVPAHELLLAVGEAEALLEKWRAPEDTKALILNACVLARALGQAGKAAFDTGENVLDSFTAEEVGALAAKYLALSQKESLSLERISPGEVQALKKAWGTRPESA